MMKNELAYRNRKGTTLWSPLSVAVCKDEKYRFLAILWGKVCVFNCIFNKPKIRKQSQWQSQLQ